MKTLPLGFRIEGRGVLLLGESAALAAKARLLLEAGAALHLVARSPDVELRGLIEAGQIEWRCKAFEPVDLEGMQLAIGDGIDRTATENLVAVARKRGTLLNIIDRPEFCEVTFPALIRRGPVTIAVCTEGSAPVLARLLRARIEVLLPQSLGPLAELAQRFRHRVREALPDSASRRNFWQQVFSGRVAQKMEAQDIEGAEVALLDDLQAFTDIPPRGFVSLVGAGPGDPELLTLKALRRLQEADVILFDALVPAEILCLARREARRIDVGKRCGRHKARQEEIGALLVTLGREGKRVVRLKGGDPYLFGRGWEEAEALIAAGIEFEAVPGITAALGCGAYAGIPLTHRDHAQSVIFLTAHGRNGPQAHDWLNLTRNDQTLAIYMGLRQFEWMAVNLMRHGLAPDTPTALIENGSRPDMRVITAPLKELAAHAARAGITGPAMIIVGEVVRLREKLQRKPAFVLPVLQVAE